MEEKWTPGPWIVTEDDRPGMEWNRAIALASNPHFEIASMNHSDGKNPEGDEANAHLIAAAPELYACLQAAMYQVEKGSGPPNWDGIRAVLRKARGENAEAD